MTLNEGMNFWKPADIKKMYLRIFGLCLILSVLYGCHPKNISGRKDSASEEYSGLKSGLVKGWNTWDTRSVLSYVKLPEGFSVNLKLYDKTTNQTLENALIGRKEEGAEKIKPGLHSYDGSYTELEIEWRGRRIIIRSVSEGDDFGLLITPAKSDRDMELWISPEILWGKPGKSVISQSGICFNNGSENISFTINGQHEVADSLIRCPLTGTILVSSWSDKTVADIEWLMKNKQDDIIAESAKYKSDSLLYGAMQSVLSWNVIYEPEKDRVIVPVSRLWNCGWGGWVLFDWDTYFSAMMLSLDHKNLAYANAIAVTRGVAPKGFIPNFSSGIGTSEDRSQPPVGSLVVKEIFKKYREEWFLREVYDDLLSWNRWWDKNRNIDGYLCWGSDVYETDSKNASLLRTVGEKQAAMYESGLDNSPMYYDAAFDSVAHRLMLADVGLMSLYISDCLNLAEIAAVIGKPADEKELLHRGEAYRNKLESLWDDKFGLYLNKDLVTGKFSYVLSPTLFYPLIAKVPTQAKARRMIDGHFFNPSEFWGEWIIPSISRNNAYFKRQDYWRGRIWAPMNYLVYLGLRNYNLPDAQKALAEKSAKLLLQSWTGERHVYENYNTIHGTGNDRLNSDGFYHWGALLGYISLIEDGYVLPPETNLTVELKRKYPNF